MKWKSFSFFILFSLASFLFTSANAALNTPVGYWKTVDDRTGLVLSVVEIYPVGNNTLQGRIVRIMPVLGQRPSDICTRCRGQMQNKPMLGLIIMWGMQQIRPNVWGRGRVLDPKSGNIYSGTMTVLNNGNNLKLHGYIGVSLLGRSEIWNRTGRP